MKADIAYKGALDICNTHAERLNWAMAELKPHFPLAPAKLAQLKPLDLAIFDQFIVRFSKLQDAMGAKLLPALLKVLGEPDRALLINLDKAEKYSWLESTDQWVALRQLRNQMTHEYIENARTLYDAISTAAANIDMLKRFADNLVGQVKMLTP